MSVNYCMHMDIQCNQAREQNFLKPYFSTQTDLFDIKMATTIIFIVYYKIANFPYIANREAIHVRASFHRFFTDFGYKWLYL